MYSYSSQRAVFEHLEESPQCHGIWDTTNAVFTECALRYLLIVPAVLIALLVLSFLSEHFLGDARPGWTRPFVEEDSQERDATSPGRSYWRWLWSVLLGILAIAPLAAHIWQLVVSPGRGNLLVLVGPIVTWTLVSLLIAARRPETCPTNFLLYYLPAFTVHLGWYIGPATISKTATITNGVSALASLLSVVVILLMPYRSSSLPIDDISKVGATPSSAQRSPEDNLRMYQFLTVSWMGSLIALGNKHKLDPEHIWKLAFQFQHDRLHQIFRGLKGTVFRRLCKANGIDFIVIATLALAEIILESVLPLLLSLLLRSMETTIVTKRVVMTYALLSLAARVAYAQLEVLLTWYGRRCYERSRGQMTMMIFEKALLRKNTVGEITKVQPQTPTPARHEAVAVVRTGILAKIAGGLAPFASLFKTKSKAPGKETMRAASIGKVLNLFRGDVYEVSQRFWELDKLIKGPIGLILAAALVWRFLGPSCFMGIISLIVAQTINAYMTKKLIQAGRKRKGATDERLQITSQFIEVIRHLRWYGWQDHWLKQVDELRDKELISRVKFMLLETSVRFINVLSSSLFPVIALYAYTIWANNPLTVDIIFPALQLFRMLESRLRDIPDLITTMINASVSLSRIEGFMEEAEVEQQSDQSGARDDRRLKLEKCTLNWPGQPGAVLTDLTLEFPDGLTVVHGKVGTGKSALLQGLLGEMDKAKGTLQIPNKKSAYCAQTAWLQSMSIRDNVLFFQPYDESWYSKVLEACQLLPDLALFKNGDLSMIGENGIGLSGGQKARVALARAVYSRADVLLLDDPLAALDHDTAESIVKQLFGGSMLSGQTTVLVTHRIDLVRQYAKQFIEISKGHATVGQAEVLQESSEESEPEEAEDVEEKANLKDKKASAIADKFVEDEHRADYGVQVKVYWAYIKAGGLYWWAIQIVAIAFSQLLDILYAWYLKAWGEAYNPTSLQSVNQTSSYGSLHFQSTDPVDQIRVALLPDPTRRLPSPVDDVKPWLLVYLILSFLQPLSTLGFMLVETVIVYSAAKRLFRAVMERVSHASFRFYDITPTGRLMNRMTSDISNVDGAISRQFVRFALYAIAFVSSLVVIASVTPMFLIAAAIIVTCYVLIFRVFLPTSQSLRRLETVSLSPLFANFGELLQGLTTVRAFKAQQQFQDRVIAVVDDFQGMDHFYWTLQSWLMFRLDNISAISTFAITALAIYTNTSAGLTAFVLIAAQNFVQSTHALCRQYGRLQMDFVSVERVEELLHIQQEEPGTVDPPASWPKFGSDIVFENVTIRYAPHMDPALRDISLTIPGGSTTALVGRTGSGKSTFAQALLGVVRPESGRILIDGISVDDVKIEALRRRVTFVAQDPVLFAGTIRHNLDPTRDFSDDECSAALGRVCAQQGWTLGTNVEAGGKNLSQGERQLISIARAVLRRSSILILDEATASIDMETSMQIQQILREEMVESTVITIAHRVEAVKDASNSIVLHEGRVREDSGS